MNLFIITLLSLSVSGSIIALVLFSLKPFIRHKLSKSWQYYIWLVVLLRLIVPFSPEVSLVGSLFQTISGITNTNQNHTIISNDRLTAPEFYNTKEDAVNELNTETEHIARESNFGSNDLTESVQTYWIKNNHTNASDRLITWTILFCIWALGVLIMLYIKIESYIKFTRHIHLLGRSVYDSEVLIPFEECKKHLGITDKINICINSLITVPMLLGIFQPIIIIPQKEYSQLELKNVFLHELIHHKRKDLYYKWFAQLVLCIHWFNPITYWVIKEINQVCELSCDEAAICTMDTQEKQSYGDTIINTVSYNVNKNNVVSTMLCEDKSNVKERLTAIMKYNKKSKMVMLLSSILLFTILCGGILTGAVTKEKSLKDLSVDISKFDTLSIGTSVPEIDYISEERVIFHSYYGLFVYDLKHEKIIQSLDLKAIGHNFMQGSTYTEVKTSLNGQKVYIRNAGEKPDKFIYEYDINSGKLLKVPLDAKLSTFPINRTYDPYGHDRVSMLNDGEGYAYFGPDALTVKDLKLYVYFNKLSYTIFHVFGLPQTLKPENAVKPISIEAVNALANGDITVNDLMQKYIYNDIGSGLRILNFPINDRYSLTIGLASTNDQPFYIHINDNLTDSWTYLSQKTAANLAAGLTKNGVYTIQGYFSLNNKKYAVVETVGDKKMSVFPSEVTLFDNSSSEGKVLAKGSFAKVKNVLWNLDSDYLVLTSQNEEFSETYLYNEKSGFQKLDPSDVMHLIISKNLSKDITPLTLSMTAAEWKDNRTLLIKYSFLKSPKSGADYHEESGELYYQVVDSIYTLSNDYAGDPGYLNNITGLPVIELKKENAYSITESGSFSAEDNQTLSLKIKSNIKNSTADLFLFDPTGNEQRITIGSAPINKDIKLTKGVWAYNCTGMFKDISTIEIIGTVK